MNKTFALPCILAALVALPVLSFAQPGSETLAQCSLAAFVSYTDLRVGSVLQSLEILAGTTEARSGKWQDVEGLLADYQKADSGLVVWFVLPDGAYYTVEKGRMDVKLTDRSYFPDLMAGRRIIGPLVISKSTGQRSAVIAVPITKGGTVVGAIGASLFLDTLSDQVAAALALPRDMGFFALTKEGLTTLHLKKDRHLLDPRELGSNSLKQATNQILSNASGEVTYEFDNATKRAMYRTSSLTGWRFAITMSAAPGE